MCNDLPFWKSKKFEEMTSEEWESLCDRCAQCCVHKVQDEDTDTVYYTNIACEHLDLNTYTCKAYATRRLTVPDCVCLSRCGADEFHWLPPTCAYRLLAEGKNLPDWHPLVSGDPDSVRAAGMCLSDVIPENDAECREEEILFREATTGKCSHAFSGMERQILSEPKESVQREESDE